MKGNNLGNVVGRNWLSRDETIFAFAQLRRSLNYDNDCNDDEEEKEDDDDSDDGDDALPC